MTKDNIKRAKLLGMPFGTANQRLRKMIMFRMIQKAGLDVCFQCKKKIEIIEELSIEHKIPWLNKENAKELFFDLDNIAFSHLRCNIGTGKIKHPSVYAYQKGCRCSECTELHRLSNAKDRAK